MKILLLLGKYLPERSGGMENYSHWLASMLLQNNHVVDVAILESSHMTPYTYESIHVFPLQNGFADFSSLLKEKQFDICHIHEYSAFGGIELFWFKEAKLYCKKVFFTFHLPYLTCYKNDFRYKGIEDCNNFSSNERCVKCIIATKLKYKKSKKFNLYNTGIRLLTPLVQNTPKIKKLRNAIASRRDDLCELINTCDHIFLIADWFKEILETNGYNSPVLRKIPAITKISALKKIETGSGIKNKIIFAGRIEKEKGLHLLCRAMNIISNKDIQLDVFGNVVDENYFKNCHIEYRFNFKGLVPRLELLKVLPEYDFLILPSVFTEMYPMIVQEAFYEKLPVIASAAKGNKDIIREGKNGFIFEYDNFGDLARTIDNSYRLKRDAWKPDFGTASRQEDDIKEILSYYS